MSLLTLLSFILILIILSGIDSIDHRPDQDSDQKSIQKRSLPNCAWQQWGPWSKCDFQLKIRRRSRKLAVIPSHQCHVHGCMQEVEDCTIPGPTAAPTPPTVPAPPGPPPPDTDHSPESPEVPAPPPNPDPHPHTDDPDDDYDPNNEEQMRGRFSKFCHKYDRYYDSDHEREMRFRIYRNNLILARRMTTESNGHTKFGETKFADLSNGEYLQKVGILLREPGSQRRNKPAPPDSELPPLVQASMPTSFDWRNKGAVTPVKDQGSCGACWAFCVACVMESKYFIKNMTGRVLKQVSEQALMDCDTSNFGCSGGYVRNAYWAAQNKSMLDGVPTLADYPYVARKGACNLTSKARYVKMVAPPTQPYARIVGENAMLQHVYNYGPVAATISASGSGFQMYKSGILMRKDCPTTPIDHCICVVGYGVLNKIPYWIVKNSWSTLWGNQGYIMIQRGNQTCGIGTDPVEALTSAVVQ